MIYDHEFDREFETLFDYIDALEKHTLIMAIDKIPERRKQMYFLSKVLGIPRGTVYFKLKKHNLLDKILSG